MKIINTQEVIPWWTKNKAPWVGKNFSHMILGSESPDELRIQRISDSMLNLFYDRCECHSTSVDGRKEGDSLENATSPS